MSSKTTVGNVEIMMLTDAEVTLPFTLDQLFPGVDAGSWEPFKQRYPGAFTAPHSWKVHTGGVLVRSQGRTILADTGIGPTPQPLLANSIGTLPDEMRRQGLDPADIDTVLMTHAHIDHVGWNVLPDGTPLCRGARYLLHQADWAAKGDLEAFVLPFGATPYVDKLLTPLEKLGVLDILDGETALTSEVTAIHTPGHTPGSMSLLIHSAGEKALIPGDVLVNPALVTHPEWIFGFDNDQQAGAAMRSAILDRIEAEGMLLASCHFPHPGFGRLIRLEGKRYWQAM